MITRREFVAGVGCAAVTGKLIGQDGSSAAKGGLVAPCGLYCGACPMYLATQENNEQRLKASGFGGSGLSKIPREDLVCDGCIGGGRVAAFCLKCAIRDCAESKTKTRSCSECAEFPCDRITGFNNDGMLHHGEVLENLRQMRAVGIGEWTKREEERWKCPECRTKISWYEPECPKCRNPRSDKLFPLKKV